MKKLFLKLPYLFKFILINFFSYLLKKKRFNKAFYDNLKFYQSIDFTENEKVNNNKIIKQIEKNSYYDDFSNINQCKILNKEIIKKDYNKIHNENMTFDYMTTSGSTGSGFKFPISREFIEQQWSIFWKFRYIHGLTTNSWSANIISQTMFDINDNKHISIKTYPTKQLLLSQYHLNIQNVESFLNEIGKSNIQWLHAFPSVLTLFANLIVEKELQNKAINLNLKNITTSSEKLHSHQKILIEKVFKTKVRELYGLTEGVANIFECEEGTLHIDESYSFVELVKIDNLENEYKIIGTSYYNQAFPLLRYDTGDTCTLYEKDFVCGCGRKSRIIKEILGRDEDYILLENGNKIGRLSSIFKLLIEIKESQIYQYKKGHAIFRIVKGTNYSSKSEELLKNQIKEKLGKDFNFEISYLEEIIKTKRGKLKFVVSEINE